MYGQTNCWVLPDGEYGAYQLASGDVLIITARAALNLAYQARPPLPPPPAAAATAPAAISRSPRFRRP